MRPGIIPNVSRATFGAPGEFFFEEHDMRSLWNRRMCAAGAVAVLAGIAWMAGPIWAGGAKVQEGKPAPEIELPATSIGTIFPDKKDAKTLKISDLKGKKNVVLWFYPKALTGG